MYAILSDVHGNLESLVAVLADIEKQGVRAIYYLGDTLGYGPNPMECLDLAMRMTVSLLGNFDQAVLFHPDGYCESAERSILWSRARLDAEKGSAIGRLRAEYLGSLPRTHREGDTLYVHGSPRNPLSEYIFPEDVYNPQKMTRIGAMFGQLCFCGHTHIPGVFLEQAPGKWEFLHAEECERGFPVAGRKLICNVGAVGQPRDNDERASYALFDGERICLRRVAYDVETTIRKIYAVPELANFLGDRLREGR
jgi:diadenosine tetraphosphatase ApaH/serine/threonine PP2A family protein phosphatase